MIERTMIKDTMCSNCMCNKAQAGYLDIAECVDILKNMASGNSMACVDEAGKPMLEQKECIGYASMTYKLGLMRNQEAVKYLLESGYIKEDELEELDTPMTVTDFVAHHTGYDKMFIEAYMEMNHEKLDIFLKKMFSEK